MKKNDEYFMQLAINEANKAYQKNEVPIGCVICKDDKVIARAYNKRELNQQSIAHAEILAIIKACKKLKSWRLDGCTIYVTLEPCPMCAGAILQSRISKVVYGAKDFKGGSLGSNFDLYSIKGFNHYPLVESGIYEKECSFLLSKFFKEKRENK